MKKLFKWTIVLSILGGIGYFVCNKFCKKDNSSCKKEA
jgi:hypothetical protein